VHLKLMLAVKILLDIKTDIKLYIFLTSLVGVDVNSHGIT